MRRAISTAVAAAALVSCGVSLSPAQVTPRLASGGHYSLSAATPPAATSVSRRSDINCSVSRRRLLGGGIPLLPANYIPYPLGLPYTPTYHNYYTPNYGNMYSIGNFAAADSTSQVENRASSRERSVRSRYDLAKSEKLIASGDARFSRKQYVQAIARYREAARAAPDASEARLRQALALIAAQKYPAAARGLYDALALRADWNDAKLHLDQLYSPGELAKTTQALTRKAESDPRNPELALALGVQLFFSGQREKAEPYFTRAVQLGADQDDRLSAFSPLGEAAPAVN